MAKNPNSPYRDTNIVDFYLDNWNEIEIPESIYDEYYTVEDKYHNRIDLLANDKLGSPSLWWVIVLRNMDSLINPLKDLKSGMEIIIPSQQTISQII